MVDRTVGFGAAAGWLIAGDWRHHPARIVTAVVAIAIGVALGFAVHLVNASALVAFGQAVQTVNGSADLQVRAAGPQGLREDLYPKVLRTAGVIDASPVIELNAVADKRGRVTLLGIDVMRAANVTPTLIGIPSGNAPMAAEAMLTDDAVFASRGALAQLKVRIGDNVMLAANGRRARFVVRGQLPGVGEGQRVLVTDIATAQWRFDRLGRIDRIDLNTREDARPSDVRRALAAFLPATALVADGADSANQADALSRAYRVNLQMLALVALLTGAFLVYSTQSLAVARRLQGFALLRTLGMQRSDVRTLVAVEGVLTGIIGGSIGIGGGYLLAAVALYLIGPGLGGVAFGTVVPTIVAEPGAAFGFFALGIAAAVGGSIIPAINGSRAAPAAALKNAGDTVDPRHNTPRWRIPLLLLILGLGAAFMPAVAHLPLFGYLAVALLLASGIVAMPAIARWALAPLARRTSRFLPLDLAVQHLHGAPNAAAIALCGIVASTSLMTAMLIMVTSFRGAVDEWLGEVLIGDLYVRSDPGTGGFDPRTQAMLRTIPGVASIAFNRQLPIMLSADRPPMTLIVRRAHSAQDRAIMIGPERPAPANTIGISLSEPAARVLGLRVGDTLTLPIAPGRRFGVTGIWRDYARQQGAIAIDDDVYMALTGDDVRDDAAITLKPGAGAAIVRRALIAAVPAASRGSIQIAEPATLRRFALSLFDRSFAITYALEGIAVLVGLAGVAATTSAQAFARTREFGMLRHIGLSRLQIVAMLGAEGALLGCVGGIAGITLGIAIGQVLIHVVNPQSFNWTMTTRLPFAALVGVIVALVLAATLTAILAGRRAASTDAVRAVRSDW